MLSHHTPAAFVAVGLLACLLASGASAQSEFALDEPVLVAAGQRLVVEGAPLSQERFSKLVLSIPGVGLYTIADQPFSGARIAGEFDGAGLFFSTEGVSVRLRSRQNILGGGRRDAYVKAEPASGARGSARVSLADVPTTVTPLASMPPRGPAQNRAASTAQPLREEVLRLRTEVARLAAEREQAGRQRDAARRDLATDLDRIHAERDVLRDERDRAVTDRQRLATQMESARREVERATEQGRTTAQRIYTQDLDELRAQVVSRDETIALLTAERDERGAQIVRLETELERLNGILQRTQSERDAAIAARDDARGQLGGALAERDAALARMDALRDAPAPNADELARLRNETRRLGTELLATKAERDRLADLTSVQPAALSAAEARMDEMLAIIASGEARIAALETELTATRGQLAQTRADLDGTRTRLASTEQKLATSEAARLALQEQTDRLAAESARIAQQRDQLTAERDALANASQASGADAREALAAALAASERGSSEREALQTELAAALEANALAASERAALEAEHAADLQAALASGTGAETDRSALEARLEAAQTAASQAASETSRLQSELATVLTERDALRRDLENMPTAPAPEASGDEQRAALDALRAERARALAEAEALRGERELAISEVRAIRAEQAAAQTERESLRAERDRLQRDLSALRDGAAAQSITPPKPVVSRPRAPLSAGNAVIRLPGFDFSRISNGDEVREALAAATYPPLAAEQGLSGELLVLFQTDPAGRVIRTAVARQLGGGLDAIAESIVQTMRFQTPTVDGQPTSLRSQIVIRFGS